MKELRDYTRVLTLDKEQANCVARLNGIALGEAAPILNKAAVTAIGTVDVPFIDDPDAKVLNQSIQRRSPVLRLLELGAVAVPSNRLLPVVPEDPEPTWATEGAAVPLARLTSTNLFTASQYYVLMLAYLKELLRIGGARGASLIFSRSVRAIARADGTVFFSDSAASAAQPAGILWNRTAVGSGSPGDLADDLEAAVAYVSDGDAFAPVVIVSPRGAAFLNASGINAFRDLGITGGTVAGAPAIVSRAAADKLILIDASELAITDDGVDIRQSQNAAIQMDDTPTNNSVTPTATQVVSAFQTGAVVLRYTRYLSWKLLREDAAAFIQLPIGGSPA
jgi:hypothetical protein